MKHRFVNKKTGVEARVIAMYLNSDGVMQVDGYDAVEDLMDDYAAYEKCEPSTEPLIKDEKIRKAVRAWAEVDGIGGVVIVSKYQLIALHKPCSIEFFGEIYPDYEHNEEHTIAELCGEEEG